jgi:hypothetical protein
MRQVWRATGSGEKRDVRATIRIAHRLVADHVHIVRACQIGQVLARGVVNRLGPRRATILERRLRQIDSAARCVFAGKGGVFAGIVRPRRVRRFMEEQETIKAGFGDRRLRRFGSVEDARRKARASEARTPRIGAIAKRCEQKKIEMTAFGRDRGLGIFDQSLQQCLFGGIVRQLDRRNLMLRFHHAPASSGRRPRAKRELGGCRDR